MQQPCEGSRNVAPPGAVPPLATSIPREREVAALVAEGLRTAEIADRLVLSPGSVGNHLSQSSRTLGTRNCAQPALQAANRRAAGRDVRCR